MQQLEQEMKEVRSGPRPRPKFPQVKPVPQFRKASAIMANLVIPSGMRTQGCKPKSEKKKPPSVIHFLDSESSNGTSEPETQPYVKHTGKRKPLLESESEESQEEEEREHGAGRTNKEDDDDSQDAEGKQQSWTRTEVGEEEVEQEELLIRRRKRTTKKRTTTQSPPPQAQ